jgi:PKD domain
MWDYFYRPPPIRGWLNRLRQPPVISSGAVPYPDFVQFRGNIPVPVGTRVVFQNFTWQHGLPESNPISILPRGGVPDSYLWDYGDGSTQTQFPNIVGQPFASFHTYNTEGIFTVSLTACNDSGCATLVRTAYINVGLTRGVSIRRLREQEQVSVRLVSGMVVTGSIKAPERISVAGIRSRTAVTARRISSDDRVSAKLRASNV